MFVLTEGIAKRDSERYRCTIETVKLIITRIIDEVVSDSFILSSSNTLCSCLCQLLGHLQDIFRKHVDNVIKMETILEKNTDKSPETENNVVAADRNNLRTCLHLLQHLWRLFGEQPTVYWKIIKDSEIGQMLNQEIGYSTVALVSRVHLMDTITAQHLINLFTTIVNTDTCAHRHVIAFFYKHVFIKYLHHIWVQVSNSVRDDFPLVELLAPEDTVNTLGLVSVENDLLEYIIDSLCDLLANPALLPSLFASFDCDPASPDLIQTMVKHVTTLAAIVLAVGAEGLGEYKEIGVQLVHCSKQLFVSFQDRSSACDTWCDSPIATTEDEANAMKEELDRITSSLQFSKMNKQAFITACVELFNADEVDKCFLSFQSLGFFPKPVTPPIIAQFLRHVHHLNKSVVGAYLGSLGKESTKEWNTVDFHAEVLKLYTETFNFTNQFALSSLRAYLSAFRLPGEAQQIDRILEAFSKHCHSQCREQKEGIIENSEVLYVLMFATIMLNTDRHNPNIKPEKKMTVDQFVRSNTNYKQDCKQTIPIPRDYLVALYDEISSFPLRTEPNSTFATVTKEEWMDMSLHADLDLSIRSLLTTATMSSQSEGYAQDDDGNLVMIIRFPHTLCTKGTMTVNMSKIQGLHFLWDKIMLQTLWQYFLIPSLSLPMSTIAQFGYYADLLPRRGKRTLKQRQEFAQTFLKEFLALSIKNGLENVLDIVVAVLLECTGILDPNIVSHLLNGTIDLEANLNFKLGDAAYDCEFHLNFVDSLSYASARSAVIMMLEIITAHSSKITNCWALVLFVLALLRDLHLLPAEMINDTESDLLPQSVRQEFEHVIRQQQEHARQQVKMQQEVLLRQQHQQRAQLRRMSTESSSALQLLGNALFGTTEPPLRSFSEDEAHDTANHNKKKSASPLDPDNIREYFNDRLNSAGSRWDASLFGLLQGVQVEVIAGLPNQRTASGQVADERGMVSVPLYDAQFM